MVTKLGRMIASIDGLLRIMLHDPLITWPCEIWGSLTWGGSVRECLSCHWLLANFTTEKFSKKNKSTQASKIQHATGTRDIFGRLLFLVITKQIDIKRIFAYPLVPEPPCLCHTNGLLRDSPKSKVFQYLKGLVQLDSLPNVETVIADGMFLIRSVRCSRTYRLFVQTVFNDCLKTNSLSRIYLLQSLRIAIT